jgi:hypothetical protein
MATVKGPLSWDGDTDDQGYRSYSITHLVLAEITEGPESVLSASGLPVRGTSWSFDDDSDQWAYCKSQKAKQVITKEPGEWWEVTSNFTSKPETDADRNASGDCKDERNEDPLLQRPKVSGSFDKFTEEGTRDRFGLPIESSSHEIFRGAQNEWDDSRPTIRIEQNLADLQLSTITAIRDHVNDGVMWGLPARSVKLGPMSFEKLYYGECYVYYRRTLEFQIKFDTWDRELLDEGTKVLSGHWGTAAEVELLLIEPEDYGVWVLDDIGGVPPDITNPSHFIRFQDRNSNNARVVLDGTGKPLTDSANPVFRHVEKYKGTNFFVLGIPTTI